MAAELRHKQVCMLPKDHLPALAAVRAVESHLAAVAGPHRPQPIMREPPRPRLHTQHRLFGCAAACCLVAQWYCSAE